MVLSRIKPESAGLYAEDFAGEMPPELLRRVERLSAANSLRFDRKGVNALTAQLAERHAYFFEPTKYYSTLLNANFDAVLIKNFLPPDASKVVCQAILLAFVSRMGTLSPHDTREDSLVWTMQARDEYAAERRFKTFSEHSAEAALHTDSQYRLKPENFLGFYVYRQARCGGGRTRLLGGERLLTALLESSAGSRCVKTLSHAKISFLIPPIFVTDPKKSFVKAAIFGKTPFIRYRADTLQPELIKGYSAGERHEIIESLDFLRKRIENFSHTTEISLNDGDLLFINNHRKLHGRTAFEDKSRCLFRIRFN